MPKHRRFPGVASGASRRRQNDQNLRALVLTRMRDVVKFFRANPQVFVLLLICLVLGLGTFLAVLFGLITASPGTNSGEPSGAIVGLHIARTAFALM
jgi:hypothetical protein